MTCRATAALLNIDFAIISVTTREIAALLADVGTQLTLDPHGLRTFNDRRRHAVAAGITIPKPPIHQQTT
jgi:hypothetical protein